MSCSNFLGMVGPCFCWGFWKKRVVGRGVLVVKLWWIAGESWEVDGQDSGWKNMPLLPGLFLRDSHFGNSVLKTARKIGKVTGINLVDETSGLMVHQSVRQDHPHRHQIHPCAGRSTQGVKLLDPRNPGRCSRLRSHPHRRNYPETWRSQLV